MRCRGVQVPCYTIGALAVYGSTVHAMKAGIAYMIVDRSILRDLRRLRHVVGIRAMPETGKYLLRCQQTHRIIIFPSSNSRRAKQPPSNHG